MHALSPREGPIESIFNFIENPLSVLWVAPPTSHGRTQNPYNQLLWVLPNQ